MQLPYERRHRIALRICDGMGQNLIRPRVGPFPLAQRLFAEELAIH